MRSLRSWSSPMAGGWAALGGADAGWMCGGAAAGCAGVAVGVAAEGWLAAAGAACWACNLSAASAGRSATAARRNHAAHRRARKREAPNCEPDAAGKKYACKWLQTLEGEERRVGVALATWRVTPVGNYTRVSHRRVHVRVPVRVDVARVDVRMHGNLCTPL